MYRSKHPWLTACLCVLLVGSAAAARAADGTAPQAGQKLTTAHSFRTSTITGMKVYNPAGEEVGSISELVVNIEKGNIEYAALSVGGFLGIGNKLFAVPWRMFMLKLDPEQSYFVLNVNRETLERAPGFDKEQWPDVADPNWARDIEKYYGAGASHDGTFERFADGQLVMKDATGKETHKHALAKDLHVVSKSQATTTSALKPGDSIRVTMADRNGQNVVTQIEVLNR